MDAHGDGADGRAEDRVVRRVVGIVPGMKRTVVPILGGGVPRARARSRSVAIPRQRRRLPLLPETPSMATVANPAKIRFRIMMPTL